MSVKKSDILQLQYSIFHGLQSCNLFNNVNVVLEREFLQQGVVDFSSIWQLPRNGKSGAGLYVEVPILQTPEPNSIQRDLVLSVVAMEEQNLNLSATTGTLLSAEEWGELVLDFLFNWVLTGGSALKPEKMSLQRAKDFVDIMAYRASVSLRRQHVPRARVEKPTLVNNALTITLACSTPGAAIYYTTDGFSFPGVANTGALVGTQAATLYTVPFAVASGTTVQACAFKDDVLPSHLLAQIVS